MEKDFVSSLHHQYSYLQLAHLNFSGPQRDIGLPNSVPADMTPQSNEVPINGNSPFFTFSGLPESKASQPAEPRNWFYCLPRFRQGFPPVSTTVPKENQVPRSPGDFGCNKYANAGTEPTQKRFLVFDQSGGQTTMIYSSINGTPVQCQDYLNPRPPAPHNLTKEDPESQMNETSAFGHFFRDEYNEENDRNDVESEMHEDTEELNALLYSDDENDYSEDDEEISTGHSPSTMTSHGLLELFDGGSEEVASSARPTKRPKLLDGGYDASSLMDTASSVKANTCSILADDTGNNYSKVSGALVGSQSGKKRPRNDKIRETLSILRAIIPGGKGKNSMVVIDEAIRYLKSLKVKAKSLGLDTL